MKPTPPLALPLPTGGEITLPLQVSKLDHTWIRDSRDYAVATGATVVHAAVLVGMSERYVRLHEACEHGLHVAEAWMKDAAPHPDYATLDNADYAAAKQHADMFRAALAAKGGTT